MAQNPEQIGRQDRLKHQAGKGSGRYQKRMLAKWRRRMERQDPESAPKHRATYRGWSD